MARSRQEELAETLRKIPESEFQSAPWTQEETNALHEMVREYMWAKTFRKKARFIVVWMLGIPGALLAFWEPVEKLWRLLSSKFGNG